eukprot:TRINITY_DN4400_c0_g1_i2.p1 TRINITY_DN4400_c0_g1~~TRINITY_DN4400_c0_g1_i2.p1  ORF type:complete len:292 (+),score=76.16 TRINITY_DN4400_c0_g1_i2:46-921(+)
MDAAANTWAQQYEATVRRAGHAKKRAVVRRTKGRRLFVGKLSFKDAAGASVPKQKDVTLARKKAVARLFLHYGKLEFVTNLSRGFDFCFVTFEKEEDASKAFAELSDQASGFAKRCELVAALKKLPYWAKPAASFYVRWAQGAEKPSSESADEQVGDAATADADTAAADEERADFKRIAEPLTKDSLNDVAAAEMPKPLEQWLPAEPGVIAQRVKEVSARRKGSKRKGVHVVYTFKGKPAGTRQPVQPPQPQEQSFTLIPLPKKEQAALSPPSEFRFAQTPTAAARVRSLR